MMTATLSRIKLLYYAAEHLIGPLLVFVISYAHHVYFVDDFVSSFFAAFSLVSLLLVMAVDKTGILLALGLQLAFLGWVAIVEPLSFMEQLLFSSSVSLALVASYINSQEQAATSVAAAPTVPQPVKSQVLADQKDKLWQDLYDARQEIKTLYEQKQDVDKIAAALKEKDDEILLVKHHLEVLALEKQQFVEDKATCEEDIKKFASHMHEMALYQEVLRQEILRLEELRAKEKAASQPVQDTSELEERVAEYEELCQDLKQQLEEESQTLEATRKELEALKKSGFEEKLSQYETECSQLKNQLDQELKTLDLTRKDLASCQTELENMKSAAKNSPEIEDRPSHYEAMYRQLKQQFEEKAKTLDEARRDLFHAQDQLEAIKKGQEEQLEPTAEERHLMKELEAIQDKLDAQARSHDEELVGYEEVIQGLLNQLHDKQPAPSSPQ